MPKCRLTERIKIEKLSSVIDDEGFEIKKWTEYYTCWSNFRAISGKEYISAKASKSENIVTFSVRYCNKVKELIKPCSSKCFRVIYKENIYDIISQPTDFNNLHKFVDIKAKSII